MTRRMKDNRSTVDDDDDNDEDGFEALRWKTDEDDRLRGR